MKQENFESKYNIHESYNQNNEYPYESILELPNVDIGYVGYYYCVKNTTTEVSLETLVDSGQGSRIYLFVEGKKFSLFTNTGTRPIRIIIQCFLIADPQHPLVPVANPFVNGAQYQEVDIPCKPSSKKWKIQLIKDGDEVKENEMSHRLSFLTQFIMND